MNDLRRWQQQMQVVSNPRYRETVGGYSVYFIGVGERRMQTQGWWPTRLDFYALDATVFPQRMRVHGRDEFLRPENTVSLFANNVLYEEYYEGPQKLEDAWIVLRPTEQNHPLKRLTAKNGYCLFRDEHQTIRQRIHEVAQIASADVSLRWMAQAAFLQILAHLCQASPHPTGAAGSINPTVRTTDVPNDFKGKVLAILNENLQADLSVDALARRLSISRSTLSHRFSAEMGETMTQLKRRLRMERAQRLMADRHRQLKEIAFEVGFSDPAYFSRLFSRTVGMTPGEYRRQLWKGRSG